MTARRAKDDAALENWQQPRPWRWLSTTLANRALAMKLANWPARRGGADDHRRAAGANGGRHTTATPQWTGLKTPDPQVATIPRRGFNSQYVARLF
jgi:hypothetical protein